MNGSDEMKVEDVHRLVEFVSKNTHKAKENDVEGEMVMNQCLRLFAKDYKYSVVNNVSGELCSQYPSKLVLLEYATADQKANDRVESLYDLPKLRELFNKARFARCRARFVLPVILYEGKHICRSATISGGAEIYGRTGLDFFFSGGESIPDGEGNAESSEWQLFNRIRGQDIRLLKTLSVKYICDLMVENKKVKFGMNVTSSEKVDKEKRYADFNILSTPYPGCEFFKEWRDSDYTAEGLKFDWSQTYVDAVLDIPPDPITSKVGIDWDTYKGWDLVQLTQAYLKLMLGIITDGDGGLLVHCISGWDRTPLFVSILRLSLWADGAVHCSLNAMEILYLTVSYDWYLFGHHLPDRLARGEEIFFFCFHFLKHITSDEFAVKPSRKNRSVSRTDSECNIDGVLLEPDWCRRSHRDSSGSSWSSVEMTTPTSSVHMAPSASIEMTPTASIEITPKCVLDIADSDQGRYAHRCGSNSSINSISSLTSNRSTAENPPIFFSTSSQEDDAFIPNGNTTALSGHHRLSPLTHPLGGATDGPTRHVASYHSSYSSSPMAVPNIRRVSDMASHSNSSGCGSWQLISGTGSLRGSASSYESPRSSASGADQSSHRKLNSIDSFDDSPRRQRLDAVRRIFQSVYCAIHGFGNGPESGAFSSLLDQFAEKVGIRSKNAFL